MSKKIPKQGENSAFSGKTRGGLEGGGGDVQRFRPKVAD